MRSGRAAKIARQEDRSEHRSARNRVQDCACNLEHGNTQHRTIGIAVVSEPLAGYVGLQHSKHRGESNEQQNQRAENASGTKASPRGRRGLSGGLTGGLHIFSISSEFLAGFSAAVSQLTIHGIPKRSTSIPNRTAQNVSAIGMVTLPFSAKARNMRSASDGSLTPMLMEKPCCFSKLPGGASEAINTWSPIRRRACRIFRRHSAGTCPAAGAT